MELLFFLLGLSAACLICYVLYKIVIKKAINKLEKK